MMEKPRYVGEKTLLCLVLDKSGSMYGDNLNDLNKGIKAFLKDIQDDAKMSISLEVSIIAFDNEVDIVCEPDLAEFIIFNELTTRRGTTAMVDALRESVRIVEDRKNFYKNNNIKYKLPWIVLMTDGAPDPDQDVDGFAAEVETLTKAQKFMLFPIGTKDADFTVLNKLAGYIKNPDKTFSKIIPLRIGEQKFIEFFEWLSGSEVYPNIPRSGTSSICELEFNHIDIGWGTIPII